MISNKFLAAAMVLALAVTAIPAVMVIEDTSAEFQSGETYRVALCEGQTYSYKPALTLTDVTLEISGTAVAAFGMTVSNGTITGVAPSVDGETTYNLTIKATSEKPKQEAYQYIQFTVNDLLTITGPDNVVTYRGATVSLNYESNYEGDGAKYSCDDLPTGLSIDEDTGVISGTADMPSMVVTDYAVYETTFTVKVEHTDSGQIELAGASQELTVHYTVYEEMFIDTNMEDDIFYVVNGMSLSDLDSEDILSLFASVENAVFSADLSAAGITGLSMNSNGQFSGTPTFMGEKSLTITATDPNNPSNTAQITIKIISVAKLDFNSVPTGGIIVRPSEV